MVSLNSSAVLVTGANRGIGLALCQQYIAKGLNVIAVCRTASEELEATGAEIIESIDVSSVQDIKVLRGHLRDRNISILINNAGILRSDRFNTINYQSMLEQLEVNALGPLRVVDALRDNLSSGAKVAMITSRMGSIEDNTSGGQYGYRMSKSALNAATKSLAIDLQPKGIAVALLHPGYVQTEMVNYGGDISADVAAERLISRIEELNIENSGSFWHSNGQILPW